MGPDQPEKKALRVITCKGLQGYGGLSIYPPTLPKKKIKIFGNKKLIFLILAFGMTLSLMVSPAIAEEYIVLARPLNLLGYITQGGAFGLIDKNKYDTEKGVQSAMMNLFIEGDYKIGDRLKFYGAGMFTVDWAYQLNANRDSWHEKLFSKSRDHLNVDDQYWQLLKEAHLTWTPGDFMFRVGK